jgi:hypothetical protein
LSPSQRLDLQSPDNRLTSRQFIDFPIDGAGAR